MPGCFLRIRAVHQADTGDEGVAVGGGVGREACDGGYGRNRLRKVRSWLKGLLHMADAILLLSIT